MLPIWQLTFVGNNLKETRKQFDDLFVKFKEFYFACLFDWGRNLIQDTFFFNRI